MLLALPPLLFYGVVSFDMQKTIVCVQRSGRQTDMFIWSLIQEIVRRLQFPKCCQFVAGGGGGERELVEC